MRAEVPAAVSGHCDPRFDAVRRAFADNFAERGEVGAAVCVTVDGHTVVDLVGGHADAAGTLPWQPDTLVNVYSVGKAVIATLLLQLVDEGTVHLDEPIAAVWPEFAVGGKADATVRHALCHRAGVPAIAERLGNDDLWHWQRMADALAATPAWFEPGSRNVYHTNTYGHLLGEITHRASGELPGARLQRLAASLGADVWCGLPDEHHDRCAEVIWSPTAPMNPPDPDALDRLEGDTAMVARGYFNPPGYSSHGVVNTAAWRPAQIPSTNMHASARGVAAFYQGLLEPDRVLSAALLAEATMVQSSGPCPVLGDEITVGLGFVPTTPRRPLGPNPRSFGHFGTGGALGFADPDGRVAFGYVMNHVIPRWQSTRNRALIEAVFQSL
jgi:CubicO group peptidase (beta-lactamase class C family)